jgi:hypothetical protein
LENKKIEIVFIDKEGKGYPLDEVDHNMLGDGLRKVTDEVAKRLQMKRDLRYVKQLSFFGFFNT